MGKEWTADDELDLCVRAEAKAIEVARRLHADPRTRTEKFGPLADGSRDIPASTRLNGVLTLLHTQRTPGWQADTAAICDTAAAEIDARAARGRDAAAARAARARVT